MNSVCAIEHCKTSAVCMVPPLALRAQKGPAEKDLSDPTEIHVKGLPLAAYACEWKSPESCLAPRGRLNDQMRFMNSRVVR